MRKDLTGHTGPNGHLHMPIIKLKKINKTNMQIYGNTATWQTATLFSSLLNVFKEGASTTVSSSSIIIKFL